MKEIIEGEKLMWGWGYCWTNYNRMTRTVAPVPLNFIFRWIREVYFWIASPQRSRFEREMHDKLGQTYRDGYEEGIKAGDRFWAKEIKEYFKLTTLPTYKDKDPLN